MYVQNIHDLSIVFSYREESHMNFRPFLSEVLITWPAGCRGDSHMNLTSPLALSALALWAHRAHRAHRAVECFYPLIRADTGWNVTWMVHLINGDQATRSSPDWFLNEPHVSDWTEPSSLDFINFYRKLFALVKSLFVVFFSDLDSLNPV